MLNSNFSVLLLRPSFFTCSLCLFSAGLFSGMVLIWNMSTDEVTYSSSSHEDPVTCLSWLSVKNTKLVLLLLPNIAGTFIYLFDFVPSCVLYLVFSDETVVSLSVFKVIFREIVLNLSL